MSKVSLLEIGFQKHNLDGHECPVIKSDYSVVAITAVKNNE